MRLIPAIDIIDGKCVRLTKGDYSTKKIYGDPLETAKKIEDSGLKYLHLVDLDGAKSSHIVNHKILKSITAGTSLKVDFGGGLKTDSDLQIAFDCGAAQITAGSIAVKNPEIMLEWLEKYGAEKIILGADAINRRISTQGWMQNSSIDVVDFIQQYEKKGVRHVICTDIARDGMLQGPSTELYSDILKTSSVSLIASGGVSRIDDLRILEATGCEAAIIGKAIYEGRISLSELSEL
ncbi:MAG: 1-(5-phosphoribosyl)-5-[(5-phosphoribosylamino)methylideneamino]imidazole-4-carboxamide isomerase [Prevotellaceae bacterium]|jgi:phosphoribosylformimino-5-aminoimidazole carboxamide ribotide isomerase|nr:1-(5-phosphoribosyl)-5-[(5-phosphoribosylamino)methylideneamino]imidazole-4-carboxamide isomerase [Prevotellaceae bacterium]